MASLGSPFQPYQAPHKRKVPAVAHVPPDTRIADFDFRREGWVKQSLNTMIRNALQRAGIHTVGQLTRKTPRWLQENVQGCGIVGVVVINLALADVGLRLQEEQDDPEERTIDG